ncbi:hypothetical protein [Xylophilus sp. GOD-11R]|uniref:hypothetical protein n=1 Tax=Xylophilus sp. GOD-11R TaxID=3089814 RepID=UPI00298D128F|nr:hypothetical protein [Xylophilus sp. GOD-11R]WPB56219.1 hypothetical protein R9X41_19050 [Xylophilus sp. GOD-11R]
MAHLPVPLATWQRPLSAQARSRPARSNDMPPLRHATPNDIRPFLPQALQQATQTDAMQAVEQSLRAASLTFDKKSLPGWIALERPETCPQWPALRTFATKALEQIRINPGMLRNRVAYQGLMNWLAQPDVCGPSVVDFLKAHQASAIQYLHFMAYGNLPARRTMRALCRKADCTTRLQLQQATEIHRTAILQCVNRMAADGFCTSTEELHAFLWNRGMRMKKELIHRLPISIASLEVVDSQVCIKGKMPSRRFDFRADDESLRLFRGRAPMVSDESGPIRAPQDMGLATELRSVFPQGFSQLECDAVMARLQPALTPEQRTAHFQALRAHGLIQVGEATEYRLDPAFLCGDVAPSEPGDDTPAGGPLHTSLSVHAIGSSRSAQGERLFRQLERWRDDGSLHHFIERVPSLGRHQFDIEAIVTACGACGLVVARDHVRRLLIDLPPSRLDDVLTARQWLKPSPTTDQLREQLGRLLVDIPYAAFAPRHMVATWINDRNADSYCTVPDISKIANDLPKDDGATEAMVQAMYDDRSIAIFADPVGHQLNLDRFALAEHLRFRGCQASADRLAPMLAARADQLGLTAGDYFPSRALRSKPGRRNMALAIMKELRLAAGDTMPPWPEFIAAFERQLALLATPGRLQRHHGPGATGVYVELDRALREAPPTPHQPQGQEHSRPAGVHLSSTSSHERPAKRARLDERLAVLVQPQAAVAITPAAQATQAPSLMKPPVPSDAGGLYELVTGMSNTLQTIIPTEVIAGTPNRGASPNDAEFVADLIQTPQPGDDTRWPSLRLLPHQWRSVAAALLADLDQGVVMRSDPADSAAPVQFVALRRHEQVLHLLDHRARDATPAGHDATAALTLGSGQFWAALPAAACRGAASRLVSYLPLPGFAQACDAIAALTGADAPLDDFARWLDTDAQIDPLASHADAHAARVWAFGMIDFATAARYMAERLDIALQGESQPLPRLSPQDQGDLLGEIDRRTAHLSSRATFFLNLPDIGRMVAVRRIDGRLHAITEPAYRPLDAVLASAAGEAGRATTVELFHI